MIMELLSTVIAGFGMAGVVLLAFRLYSRKPPKFLLPMTAGLTMLVFNIYTEYAWYSTVSDQLPEHVEVVQTYASATVFRPWTLLKKPIKRFAAIDTANTHRHKEHSNLVLTEMLLLQKYQQETYSINMIYDCETPRYAEIGLKGGAQETGIPAQDQWSPLDANDPIRAKVCALAS